MKKKFTQTLTGKNVIELHKLLQEKKQELFTQKLDHQLRKIRNARIISQLSDQIAIIYTYIKKMEVKHEKAD